MSTQKNAVVILGVFVADLTFRAPRQPKMGETVLGSSFALGPGGKGSNQAVAAARLGADVTFITKLGNDEFARMGINMWRDAGIKVQATQVEDDYTGAAYIFVDDNTGDNAIIISPGAASTISTTLIDAHHDVIANAAVFMTQLEQPLDAATRALEIASAAGVTTIMNPAPAAPLADSLFALCDFITPNETEAQALTGIEVTNLADARAAADKLLSKGVGTALITLGEAGALLHNADHSTHVPAFNAGNVVETTGAGDAFNGGFASALARGRSPIEAVEHGCATAALSVTRAGTAQSMPTTEEVDRVLAQNTRWRPVE